MSISSKTLIFALAFAIPVALVVVSAVGASQDKEVCSTNCELVKCERGKNKGEKKCLKCKCTKGSSTYYKIIPK